MFVKNISTEAIRHVLAKGEIIKRYDDDLPYPSCLMLGFDDAKPIHVVVAKNNQDQSCVIITAYEPDKFIWNTDFKTKKK